MLNSYFCLSKDLSSQKQNLECSKNPEEVLQFKAGDEPTYQNLIISPNYHSYVWQEIEIIKSQIQGLKTQNTRYQQIIQKLERQKKQLQGGSIKNKKIFKKNLECPYDSCASRYSSKIALNSHIREKHKPKIPAKLQVGDQKLENFE